MDAAVRAELDALRLRAYGPDADIDGDPVALARLRRLEEVVRAGRADAASGAVVSAEEPATRAGKVAVRRRSRPRTVLLGAGAALAVLLAIGQLPALRPGSEPVAPASTLEDAPPAPLRVGEPAALFGSALVVDSLGSIAIPEGADGPVAPPHPASIPYFPTTSGIEWAMSLGSFYGWELWVAGAAGLRGTAGTPLGGGERCILLARGDVSRGTCYIDAGTVGAAGQLAVQLSLSELSDEVRRPAFPATARVRFVWDDPGAVDIVLTDGAR